MGLTLDESALLLELDDVYWSREGLLSVQITLAVTALLASLALGLRFLRRGEQVGDSSYGPARRRAASRDGLIGAMESGSPPPEGPQAPATSPAAPYAPDRDGPETPAERLAAADRRAPSRMGGEQLAGRGEVAGRRHPAGLADPAHPPCRDAADRPWLVGGPRLSSDAGVGIVTGILSCGSDRTSSPFSSTRRS